MYDDMRPNYEVLEVATGKMVLVSLLDLTNGLESGKYSTNFGNGEVQKPARKAKAVSDENQA